MCLLRDWYCGFSRRIILHKGWRYFLGGVWTLGKESVMVVSLIYLWTISESLRERGYMLKITKPKHCKLWGEACRLEHIWGHGKKAFGTPVGKIAFWSSVGSLERTMKESGSSKWQLKGHIPKERHVLGAPRNQWVILGMADMYFFQTIFLIFLRYNQHLSVSLAFKCSHRTEFWPIEYGWK